MLQAGVACHQGWTLEQARSVPLLDLYTLVAYKALEAEELRPRQEPFQHGGSGASAPKLRTARLEYTLKAPAK